MREVGRPDTPASDGWMNGVLPCSGFAAYGHNAGMLPSSLIRCGGSAFADDPNVACTETVAGDPFDAMGSGCRHVNVWQKAYAGWLLGCNGVRVGAGGTFTLLPVELPCDGVQLLQVPMAKQRSFLTYPRWSAVARQSTRRCRTTISSCERAEARTLDWPLPFRFA